MSNSAVPLVIASTPPPPEGCAHKRRSAAAKARPSPDPAAHAQQTLHIGLDDRALRDGCAFAAYNVQHAPLQHATHTDATRQRAPMHYATCDTPRCNTHRCDMLMQHTKHSPLRPHAPYAVHRSPHHACAAPCVCRTVRAIHRPCRTAQHTIPRRGTRMPQNASHGVAFTGRAARFRCTDAPMQHACNARW